MDVKRGTEAYIIDINMIRINQRYLFVENRTQRKQQDLG